MKFISQEGHADVWGRGARWSLTLVLALIVLSVCFSSSPSASARVLEDLTGAPSPTLTTDKADYSPEETVAIAGTAFDPGQTYDMVVIRPDGSIIRGDGNFNPDHSYTCDAANAAVVDCWDSVTADSGGSLTYQYVLDGIAGSYEIRAYASPWSGDRSLPAITSVTFTDATVNGAVFSILDSTCTTPTSSFTVGSTACARATVSVGGGGTNPDMRFQWYNSATISAATLVSDSLYSGVTNNQIVIESRALPSSGTWTVLVCKTGNPGNCSAGQRQSPTTFRSRSRPTPRPLVPGSWRNSRTIPSRPSRLPALRTKRP